MAEQGVPALRAALFCEDEAHELFVRALLRRLAREAGISASLHPNQTRGGRGAAIREFGLWQQTVRSIRGPEQPDLTIVVIDANCSDWAEHRSEVEAAVDPRAVPHCVIGCPDPHIERWFLADPRAFQAVVGVARPADPGKCERALYKRLLTEVADAADLTLLTGQPAELAPDLVAAMDLYRAGKGNRALGRFLDDLSSAIRLHASRASG